MTGKPLIPVLAAPHLDPAAGRITLDLPEGLTLAQILAAVLPGATAEELLRCRVALVTDQGSQIVLPGLWHRVRPRPGVRVVIRVIPGKDGLRSLLSIVVSIAAIAAGQLWGLKFGQLLGLGAATAGPIGTALLGVGVSIVGNLLINALIPPDKPESRDAQNRYSISGWKNRYDPDGPVPDVLGQIRVAPPFAALSHTEIVGDFQHVVALFNLGYGPVEVDDIRIGETSLSEYSDVGIELRYGLPGDLPVSLMPRQIAEEAVGLQLVRPLPRDGLGEIIAGDPAIETPVVRTTGADASGASVILAFPAGLYRVDGKGRTKAETLAIRIEQRLATADPWLLVVTLEVTAKKLEAFYRQHTWQFPLRGRWQVRVTLMTDESDAKNQPQRSISWAALQTLRPEYPLAFGKPLALVAIRVKATYQLSGALDNLNCLVRRLCLDWDHLAETWILRATSNPASLFRLVLQGPGNARPVSDAGIDLEQLADWHDFCRIKGLKFDRVLEEAGTTLRDVLAQIAGAGRASPRHDGLRWGVVIDRPQELVVDHINPRNSWDFSVQRSYVRPPDAFRLPFLDATNDYRPAVRIVRWPGFEGPIELTEVLEIPGKTDPEEVAREGLRRMYEAIHRPDIYQVTQDGPARVATRGDAVRVSHYVLNRAQVAARVRSVLGRLVEIDEPVSMTEGLDYALRFRVFADAEDTIGASVLRLVVTVPGEREVLTLPGDGPMPQAGDLVHFGPAAQESFALVVSEMEAAEGNASIFRLVDAAPQIDTLVDAAVIPSWSGRVGQEIDPSLLAPPAPRFAGVTSGVAGSTDPDRIDVLLVPGSGLTATSAYQLEHRLAGATGWTVLTLPAANGGGPITSYLAGDAVELRALALSPAGVASAYTMVVSLVVGSEDAPIPGALEVDSIIATGGLGGAVITFATGPDANTVAVQLYRSTTGTLDRLTDASGEPVPVTPMASFALSVGDIGRVNALDMPGFDVAGTWVAGAGWSIAGGVATHAPGSTATLYQSQTLVAGKYYRLAFRVAAHAAGSVTPELRGGGSPRAGTARSAAGLWMDRIQAVSGNTSLAFNPSSSFDGAVDDVVMFVETAACLAQGTHYLWLEPQNDDGLPGPVSGPFTVTIL